jgi:superfamily I DNA/RNA helicase
MRFPNSRDLNDEQEQVYLYAPVDGRMLVTGPPGTGKTVLAVLRAIEVAKSNRSPVVAMFNKVLQCYSADRNPERSQGHWDNVRFTTVHRFFAELWDRLGAPTSNDDEWLLLATPYDEKEAAKTCGAVWDKQAWYPGKKRPGCWKIDGETYRRDEDRFAHWEPRAPRPSRDGDSSDIDWDRYALALGRNASTLKWDAIDFDVLIVDEAQDFPPPFFTLLRRISEGFFGNKKTPAILILADDNQRISQSNSTVAEIVRELEIPNDRHYRLTTNFRNTQQVAKVARHFYAGMASGVPKLPERTGPVPELRRCSDKAAVRARILRYAENNPRHEIGVICLGADWQREQYFSDLRGRAPSNLTVQTYSSVNPLHKDANELLFGKPGVTVLNRASCKGLEFDAVFIVSLEEAPISNEQADFFKMNMYVMCSRSRENLYLVWNGRDGRDPPVIKLMPNEPIVRIRG